jgi:hypothetical protein
MLSLHTPRDAIALSLLKHGGRTPGAAKFLQHGNYQSSILQRTIETAEQCFNGDDCACDVERVQGAPFP